MNIRFFIVLLSLGIFSFNSFSQNVDSQMQELLANKRIENQSINHNIGYRIQLYNGISEGKTRSIIEAFSALFPDISTHLIYEQPEWKAQTLTFKTELEAYKLWLKVREEFTGTFVFEYK